MSQEAHMSIWSIFRRDCPCCDRPSNHQSLFVASDPAWFDGHDRPSNHQSLFVAGDPAWFGRSTVPLILAEVGTPF